MKNRVLFIDLRRVYIDLKLNFDDKKRKTCKTGHNLLTQRNNHFKGISSMIFLWSIYYICPAFKTLFKFHLQ